MKWKTAKLGDISASIQPGPFGSQLHNSDYSESADSSDNGESTENYQRLHQLMAADGITPLTGYCYLLFVLLYFPCLATIAAIKNETGSWRWAVFAAVYTTVVAWIVSAAVFQIGQLL